MGVISQMRVSITEGDGSIYGEKWPLSELDTQASARLAVSVAQDVTNIAEDSYNYYFSIISDASVIGGHDRSGILHQEES